MTKAATFTRADIQRAITAARDIDPRQVVEIEKDGVVLRFPPVNDLEITKANPADLIEP